MTDLATLAARHGSTGPGRLTRRWRRAAVAVVFRERSALEVLLIQRATRPGRRWSGDMAFPGGLREEGDASLADTARRECEEEVGLVLGEPFGRLPDVLTAVPRGWRPMAVSPFLFTLPPAQEPAPASDEVADLAWVAVDALRDPRRRERDWKRIGRLRLPFPVVRIDGREVWGLTLQMLDRL